jgi:hypothetical protein
MAASVHLAHFCECCYILDRLRSRPDGPGAAILHPMGRHMSM